MLIRVLSIARIHQLLTLRNSVYSNRGSDPRPPALEPVPQRLRVLLNGVEIANTTKAYMILETTHPVRLFTTFSTIIKSECLDPFSLHTTSHQPTSKCHTSAKSPPNHPSANGKAPPHTTTSASLGQLLRLVPGHTTGLRNRTRR